MDNDKLSEYLTTIKETWHIPALESRLVAKVWADSLRPFTFIDAMNALSSWIKASNFPPKVSDLVDLCQETELHRRRFERNTVEFSEPDKDEELPEDHELAWRQFHIHWLRVGIVRVGSGKPYPWGEKIAAYEQLASQYALLRISCQHAIQAIRNPKGEPAQTIMMTQEPEPTEDGLPF